MENFVPHKQGDAYDNDEERRMGYLIATRKCSAKPWACDICNVTIRTGSRTNHKKSIKHQRNITKQ